MPNLFINYLLKRLLDTNSNSTSSNQTILDVEANKFALERAYLLAELVEAGLGLLGRGDGFAPSAVEGAKIAQQRGGVEAAGA